MVARWPGWYLRRPSRDARAPWEGPDTIQVNVCITLETAATRARPGGDPRRPAPHGEPQVRDAQAAGLAPRV